MNMTNFRDGDGQSYDYEKTPQFERYISARYDASFDKSRLTPAKEMHAKGRALLGMEDFNE